MRKKTAWWMIALVLFSGCVPSMHAVYTDKDLAFNPEVLGVWQQQNSPETWEFEKRDAKSYRLIYTDRQGHSGSFIAHLADVEGIQFLDLFPEQTHDATPGFYRFHQIPIHSIYLVKEVGEKVVLAAIDYPWLEKYVKDHPTEVPSATFGSRHMLTASTEQLQRFLIDNKTRFIHDFELQRTIQDTVQ
ncbi:MAG: hypothetical protein H8E66_04465 [Planctomycetes bacterium]|nr:hypothetical protein [Planctomycetota bacterium]